jgi:ribose transport system permease protein
MDSPLEAAPPAPDTTTRHRRSVGQLLRPLSPRNIGAIYVFALVIIVFGIWSPAVFLRVETFTSILDQQAIAAIVTIGLLVALAAGQFDLSFGYTLGLSNVIYAWFLLHSSMPLGFKVLIVVMIGAGIGLVNGLVVVGWRLDSFIATLATGSIIEGMQILISGNQSIVPTQLGPLYRLTGTVFGKITYPVVYLIVISLIVWYVFEFTPLGRRLFATGSGLEAARLMGVKTGMIRVGAFMVTGAFAAFGGVLVTGLIGQGSPTVGPEYLLPAYAAAFLGATQLRQSRFNVWGTIIAIFLLATASQGLFLVGLPSWVSYVFNGAALLAAIVLSRSARDIVTSSRLFRIGSRRRSVVTPADSVVA